MSRGGARLGVGYDRSKVSRCDGCAFSFTRFEIEICHGGGGGGKGLECFCCNQRR